jgi:peptidoglycan hydrolase-like protein with peptidoglycan-binding domain
MIATVFQTQGENKMRKNVKRLLYSVLFVAALSLFTMTAISSTPSAAHAATSVTTGKAAETVGTANHCPPTLYYGSKHHDWVQVLQINLQERSYHGRDGKQLEDDGKYGPNTLYAVKNFQSDNGLVSDGIVGKKTWHALGYC